MEEVLAKNIKQKHVFPLQDGVGHPGMDMSDSVDGMYGEEHYEEEEEDEEENH